MGNPLHFSLELPQRCLQLIDDLWPHAQLILQKDRPELGSLTTTFLISMSMPIINLPVERIERHRAATGQAYADDRHIDGEAATSITAVLGGQELGKAPFFGVGSWSYVYCPKDALFNISNGLPELFAERLGSEGALENARKMPASQWCSILRNAMAHGGIGYLDADGRSSYERSVAMYVFISAKYDRENRDEVVGLHLLRISENDYRTFLRKWVDWLRPQT